MLSTVLGSRSDEEGVALSDYSSWRIRRFMLVLGGDKYSSSFNSSVLTKRIFFYHRHLSQMSVITKIHHQHSTGIPEKTNANVLRKF